MVGSVSDGTFDMSSSVTDERPAPLLPGQEWANALTHGSATLGAILFGWGLATEAATQGTPLTVACVAYALAVVGTFAASTLSHTIHRQPWLNTFRSWDQAMIYLMIAGTYTPIAVAYAPEAVLLPMLVTMWLAAWTGFFLKVFRRHRINAIGVISYLLLGWLPAIPLTGHVPGPVVSSMVIGGVLYTVGVVFLLNDRKVRYFHAVWHLFVIAAATVHFLAIRDHVVAGP